MAARSWYASVYGWMRDPSSANGWELAGYGYLVLPWVLEHECGP